MRLLYTNRHAPRVWLLSSSVEEFQNEESNFFMGDALYLQVKVIDVDVTRVSMAVKRNFLKFFSSCTPG
jgi:hypothetical protein